MAARRATNWKQPWKARHVSIHKAKNEWLPSAASQYPLKIYELHQKRRVLLCHMKGAQKCFLITDVHHGKQFMKRMIMIKGCGGQPSQ